MHMTRVECKYEAFVPSAVCFWRERTPHSALRIPAFSEDAYFFFGWTDSFWHMVLKSPRILDISFPKSLSRPCLIEKYSDLIQIIKFYASPEIKDTNHYQDVSQHVAATVSLNLQSSRCTNFIIRYCLSVERSVSSLHILQSSISNISIDQPSNQSMAPRLQHPPTPSSFREAIYLNHQHLSSDPS